MINGNWSGMNFRKNRILEEKSNIKLNGIKTTTINNNKWDNV